MKVQIDGVEYVLGGYSWGDELEQATKSIGVKALSDGGVDEAGPSVNVKQLFTDQLLKCLQSWTFRGYDPKTNTLAREGEILPITRENLFKLHPGHGNALVAKVKEFTSVTAIEIKN